MDGLIRIDRVQKTIIREIKYSPKLIHAARAQLLYYLFYMKQRGILMEGILSFPRQRRQERVVLQPGHESEILAWLEQIQAIERMPSPPRARFMPIHRNCAYRCVGGKRKGMNYYIFKSDRFLRRAHFVETDGHRIGEHPVGSGTYRIVQHGWLSCRPWRDEQGRYYHCAFDRMTLFAEVPFIRTRRPPRSPLNALLSFANAILYPSILQEVYRTLLDPSISYLHEPGERRFSMILDFADVFRLPIGELTMPCLVNRKQIQGRTLNP